MDKVIETQITVDAVEALQHVRVVVRVKRMREARWRTRIAVALIKLAGLVTEGAVSVEGGADGAAREDEN